MKSLVLPFALCAFIGPARAASPCDEAAAKVSAMTDAVFLRRAELTKNVFLSHPAASDLMVVCGPGAPSVSVGRDGAPTADYLKLATMAGYAILGRVEKRLPRDLADCLKKARRSEYHAAEIEAPYAEISCTSFVGDGGGNNLEIGPKR